ncbi:MAG: ATP-binding protein [Candidatus Dojkabacteria bacterium]|nr:ATP-binding protein [Candidatus Dojkabacteria bacterium]
MKNVKPIINKIFLKRDLNKKIETFKAENPEPQRVFCPFHPEEVILEPRLIVTKNFLNWSIEKKICPRCAYKAQEDARREGASTLVGVPPRYAFKNVISDFYETFFKKQGVIFAGKPGTGKTYEALKLAIDLYIRTGKLAKFETAIDIAIQLRTSIQENQYKYIINNLSNRDILFIDDLGAEVKSEFMHEALRYIINHRYNYLLPVIITTNLTSKELIDCYGISIISRLYEMCEIVVLDGDDKRLIKN